MLANPEVRSLIFLLSLFPLVCPGTTHQCNGDIDYQSYFLLRQAARKNHSATPIYGTDPARPASDARGFDSEIEAVTAAVNIYNPDSIDRDKEYIGVILEWNGFFYYTVGEGNRGEDSVELHFRIPAIYSIVAFWHTHGAPAYKRKYFSDTDRHLVSRYNKPFYLADFTGSLKVLLPDKKTSQSAITVKPVSSHMKGYIKGILVRSEHGDVLNICTAQHA